MYSLGAVPTTYASLSLGTRHITRYLGLSRAGKGVLHAEARALILAGELQALAWSGWLALDLLCLSVLSLPKDGYLPGRDRDVSIVSLAKDTRIFGRRHLKKAFESLFFSLFSTYLRPYRSFFTFLRSCFFSRCLHFCFSSSCLLPFDFLFWSFSREIKLSPRFARGDLILILSWSYLDLILILILS